MIFAKFTRNGTVAAMALEAKGITGIGVRWFAVFLGHLGLQRVVNFSDNEGIEQYLKSRDWRVWLVSAPLEIILPAATQEVQWSR